MGLSDLHQNRELFTELSIYHDFQTLMSISLTCKTIHRLCDATLWSIYWSNKKQSFTERSQWVAKMYHLCTDDQVNQSFLKGTLKIGINLGITHLDTTIIEYSIRNNHPMMISTLVGRGCDINSKDITSLVNTCFKRSTERIEFLETLLPYLDEKQLYTFLSCLILRIQTKHNMIRGTSIILGFINRHLHLLTFSSRASSNFIQLSFNKFVASKRGNPKNTIILLTEYMFNLFLFYPKSDIFHTSYFKSSYVDALYHFLDQKEIEELLFKYSEMLLE